MGGVGKVPKSMLRRLEVERQIGGVGVGAERKWMGLGKTARETRRSRRKLWGRSEKVLRVKLELDDGFGLDSCPAPWAG